MSKGGDVDVNKPSIARNQDKGQALALQTLDYDGPLALSCNDTKLHTTFHLYWDSKKQAHFLVGSIDGPLLVLDPEVMKEVIDSAKAQKAVKVVSL